MFSILITDAHGNERLREDAVEVRRLSNNASRRPAETDAGVLIRWSDGVETHFGEARTNDEQQTIYVMNRNGSTVATYSL
jgi:hypothetical protein